MSLGRLEIAKLFAKLGSSSSSSFRASDSGSSSSSGKSTSNTHTVTGIATSDSADGYVYVNMGGDTVSYDQTQSIQVSTTVSVKKGDIVVVNLAGADSTGKTPMIIGVKGGGDRTEKEIKNVSLAAQEAKDVADGAQKAAAEAKEVATATGQHFFDDENGAHVTTSAGNLDTGGASTWNSNGMVVLKDGKTLSSQTGSGTNYYDEDGNIIASYNNNGAQIGKATKVHSIFGTSSFGILNGNNESVMSVDENSINLGENFSAAVVTFCGKNSSMSSDGHRVIIKSLDSSSESSTRIQGGSYNSLDYQAYIDVGLTDAISAIPTVDIMAKRLILNVSGEVLDTANSVLIKDLRTKINHVALYPSSGETSPTLNNISLNYGASGYKYLEIFYHDTDGAYESKRIFRADGAIVKLSTVQVGGDKDFLSVKSRWVRISGTSISTLYTPEEFSHNSSSTEGTNTDKVIVQNKIYIDRVEGWN